MVESSEECGVSSLALTSFTVCTSLETVLLLLIQSSCYDHVLAEVSNPTSGHLSLVSEGDHSYQQGPTSLPRRLRSLYHHRCRTSSSRRCERCTGVIRLNRPNLDRHERKAHIGTSKADPVATENYGPVEFSYAAVKSMHGEDRFVLSFCKVNPVVSSVQCSENRPFHQRCRFRRRQARRRSPIPRYHVGDQR